MTVDVTLTRKDRKALRGMLLAERDRGVAVPLIPADVDIDGDGIVDAFGLDENDEVIVISGVALEHTVFESTGEPPTDDGGAD